MNIEIFDASGDYMEKRWFKHPPVTGDEIDLIDEDGRNFGYKVTRVYRHFDKDNNVTPRIQVSYIGSVNYSGI